MKNPRLDRRLNRRTEGHGLIGVDGLARFFIVEEPQIADCTLKCASTRDKHHIMHAPFVDATVAQAHQRE